MPEQGWSYKLPWLVLVSSLILAPAGIALQQIKANELASFLVNLAAIVPAVALYRESLYEIVCWLQISPACKSHGFALGAIMESFLGDGPELIFSIICVWKRQTAIAQTALTGAILSNAMLVFGTALIFAGWSKDVKTFHLYVAKENARMLMIGITSLVLPAGFVFSSISPSPDLVPLSRGTSILLLILYFCFHVYSFSPSWSFSDESDFDPTRLKAASDMNNPVSDCAKAVLDEKNPIADNTSAEKVQISETANAIMYSSLVGTLAVSPEVTRKTLEVNKKRLILTSRRQKLSPLRSSAFYLIANALLIVSTVYMMEDIDAPNKYLGISRSFTGLIMIPASVGAIYHILASVRASRDDIEWDWIVQTTVTSSFSIALYVLPLTIIIAWVFGDDSMTLQFDGFQVIVLFVCTASINFIFTSSKIRWIYGAMLLSTFLSYAIAAWYYPNDA